MNQARKLIATILKDRIDDSLSLAENKNSEDHFFRNFSSRVTLFAPISEYEISTPYKTIACLERGGQYPAVIATSGWSHGNTITLVSEKKDC